MKRNIVVIIVLSCVATNVRLAAARDCPLPYPCAYEIQAMNDDATCKSYGFRAGTDAFAECRMKLAQQRQSQDAAALAERERVAAEQERKDAQEQARTDAQINAIGRWLANPRSAGSTAPAYSGPTYCRTTRFGNMTDTNCY
ncbi:MAG: hypothetical protein AB7F35_25470 [Acetobacteraceae bacterium]|uniref:hypothetical protein n=1 Tax=Bradyrhizobium sp. TaxID=376 RepID=UPI003D09AAD9